MNLNGFITAPLARAQRTDRLADAEHPTMRGVVLGAVVAAFSVLTVSPSASAAGGFGHGSAAWDAYYNNPSSSSTWTPFCQGGGGTYLANANGVPACGPTGGTTIYLPVSSTNHGNGTYTPGFQCVELAERYLFVRKGWSPISGTNGAQVVAHYASAHGVGIVKDGTIGKVPQVGTVISFSKYADYSDYGHVAVVTGSTVNSSGNGSITIVSENVEGGTAKAATLSVSGWMVSRYGFNYAEWLDMTVSPTSTWPGVGTTAPSANRGSSLSAGQYLYPGQYLASPDLRSALVLQSDGNLVDYALGGKVLWQSGTSGRQVKYAKMQSDGNFVLYFTDGRAPWSAETSTSVWRPGGTRITLQSDGNLVIYNGASPAAATWASSWDSGTLITANVTYAGRDRLAAGSWIYPKTFLRSADRRYALLLQSDGNLVLYGPGYHVLWNSRTAGIAISRGVMGSDGSFALYRSGDAEPSWSTGTAGSGGARLVVQSDGNVVIYRIDGTAVWNTRTNGKI